MLNAKQFFYLSCDEDHCESRFPSLDDEISAWGDPVILLEQAKDDGDWLMWSGKHFCADHVCWCEVCEDEIVPLKIKLCDNCRREEQRIWDEEREMNLQEPNDTREISNG